MPAAPHRGSARSGPPRRDVQPDVVDHRFADRLGDGWLGAKRFETPLATTRRLDAAGYVDIECWLSDEPTRFEPGEPFETFLRTVVLGDHVERLPAGERDAFVHAVAETIGEPVIDYVRLNITARRSETR